jgi:hypothetical protein
MPLEVLVRRQALAALRAQETVQLQDKPTQSPPTPSTAFTHLIIAVRPHVHVEFVEFQEGLLADWALVRFHALVP